MLFLYKKILYQQRSDSDNSGFTLIELLITIILVGILSAIALPSFLRQTSRARGAEAKSMLGSINRAQQSYRMTNGSMANSLLLLQVQQDAKFYDYQIIVIDSNNAITVTETIREDLRLYSSRVQQNSGIFDYIICESNFFAPQGSTAISPTDVSICAPNYNEIE